MTKVRSEYIKKLMTESHNLEDKLKDVAQSTINSILEEKTNKNLRQILAEDEDSFSEEEVGDDVTLGGSDASNEEGASADVDSAAADDDSADNGEWDDLEQYKDEDGEYDLRSMDKDELVKVLKVMSPDDAVRIVKNEDDSLTVTDEANDEEFELELGNEEGGDTDEFGDEDGEIEIEIDSDDDLDGGDDDFADDVDGLDGGDDDDFADDDTEFEIELDESNLGYTDNYQKKTAMTTPDNHEPADSNSTYSMDGGVPTGTSKPWVGPKKKAPYEDEVNECGGAGCGEQQLEEGGHTVTQNGPYSRGDGKTWTPNSDHNTPRNGSKGGVKEKGTADNMYSDVSESIKKKANAIFLENKQLKALMGKLQSQVNEAIVVNQSLANVIKIINENATTVNEKKDILRRFNECTTREESNKLYSVISEELKRDGKTHTNVAGTINSQLSESRDRAVETPMYKSQDLSDTLSFMARLDAVK